MLIQFRSIKVSMLQMRSLLVSMEAGRWYSECRISDILFQRISLTPSHNAANFLLLEGDFRYLTVHISKSPKDVLTA